MRRRWLFLLVEVLLTLQFTALTVHADGRPFRGSVKWSILLCRFTDGGAVPHNATFYRDMFLNPGTGGLADYWDDISYGGIDLNGSDVRGWYNLNITLAQGQALDRWGRVDACVNAAKNAPTNAYQVPSGNRVAVITFPAIDMFGWNGGAFLPHDVDVGGMAHEVGHGISLNHSFSDDPTYRNADWAAIGEYDDPWDVMSWGNAFRVPTMTFGDGPVGLNAFHLDRMGWLPRSRILTFGADGAASRTLTLAALDHPDASGRMLIRVPFDPSDLNRYYTIELRRKTNWDGGIPANIVLIHEVKKRDDVYYTFLLRERTPQRNPVQSVNANGITIAINGINAAMNQATVTITSQFVDRCLQGYVWREAVPNDHVCVTPPVRTETRDENMQAANRRSPTGGAYGPDTCKQGFVWREAFPNDHVCVSPASRTRARADNVAAASRINPARIVYGPNTCKQGFVWREADERDWVCVTGQVRAQTRSDNQQAGARRSPTGGAYGPDTCKQGFVWREAFPGDHVCVPPPTRTQARQDNAQANARLAYQ